MRRLTLLTLAIALLAATPAAAHDRDPSLADRAILPADASWPAPFPGVVNTDPAPSPGARQPVGGFSALLAGPRGSYLAMPDNGFGTKANSRSFLLRVYNVKPKGYDVEIKGAINLRDPDQRIPFALVNEGTEERYLVSDLTALDKHRFVSLERDNFQGPVAVHKRAFVWDGRSKREVLDQLDIADPKGISLDGPVRDGDFGLGDPFKMPYQTIEAVLPVGKGELAIVNDTNFGSTGRNAGLPDYSDFIRVKVPALRG